MILRRFRPVLKNLDIDKDFIEISTTYEGQKYVVRIEGVKDINGRWTWNVEKVINKSIIPSRMEYQ